MHDTIVLVAAVLGMVGIALAGGRWVKRDDAVLAVGSEGYDESGWLPARHDEAVLAEARRTLEASRGL